MKKIIIFHAMTFFCVIHSCILTKKRHEKHNLAPYTFNTQLERSSEATTKQSTLRVGQGTVIERIEFFKQFEGHGNVSYQYIADTHEFDDIILTSLRAIQEKDKKPADPVDHKVDETTSFKKTIISLPNRRLQQQCIVRVANKSLQETVTYDARNSFPTVEITGHADFGHN